jgi:HEAT repeat protein
VAIDIENGEVVDIDTYVGGRWRQRSGSVDLGLVSVIEASEYLLALAETSSGDVAERAIFPAGIADSVEVWPRLLRLAKNESRPSDARRAAVFWLSMIAADVAVEELGELANDVDGDLEVREMALFGLSQLSDGQGVPALLDVARTNENREMRKQAIFWLGQTDDPRAIALFEEILTARR